jgi:hypothetical protein
MEKAEIKEMDLVKTIKLLIDNYDHSPEIVADIKYFVQKLDELLHTGVEKIEV